LDGVANTVSQPAEDQREYRDRLWVGFFLVAGAVLRLSTVTTRGLWLDEAITASQASQTLQGLMGSLSGGVHPPLFHLIMHYWVVLFGRSEVALRSFSLVIGVATIPAAFWAGRRLFDRRTGLIAAALVAFSPFHIWYSQEARMYALLFLAGMLSTTYLILACREQTWAYWRRYLLWTLVALFTHYFSLFLVMGQVIYYIFWELVARELRLRREGRARASLRNPRGIFTDVPTFGPWLVCAAVAALLLALWVSKSVFVPGGSALIESASGAGVGYGLARAQFSLRFNAVAAVIFQMMLGFHAQATTDSLVALWPLLMYGMFLLMSLVRPVGAATRVLLAAAVIGTVGMLAVGQWQEQMLVSRYFTAVGGPIYLLAARVIAKLDRRATTPVLVALAMLAGLAWADQSYNPLNSARYANREVFQAILAEYRTGDAIIYEPSYLNFLAKYYLPSGVKASGVPVPNSGAGFRNDPAQLGQDLEGFVREAPRVWLVLSFQDIEAVRNDAGTVRSWFENEAGYRLERNVSLNKVQLLRYDAVDTGEFFLPLPGAEATGAVPSDVATSGTGGAP
jgi:uncharacterized membrane protein